MSDIIVKDGVVVSPDGNTYIFNKSNRDFGLLKQYSLIVDNGQEYLIDPNKSQQVEEQYKLSNYIVANNMEGNLLFKELMNVHDDERDSNYMLTDKILVTDNMHVWNKYITLYVKTYPYIGSANQRQLKSILKMLTEEPEKPLTHLKTEQLFEHIGCTYLDFFNWIIDNNKKLNNEGEI
nr:MAG TPA: hypothetical protein [Caudoviricetes sp.]